MVRRSANLCSRTPVGTRLKGQISWRAIRECGSFFRGTFSEQSRELHADEREALVRFNAETRGDQHFPMDSTARESFLEQICLFGASTFFLA